jgi:hypothetical protein
MPPIGSEMTIVGVKHEVVKYSYDVEYDIAVDSNTTVDPRSEPHYGYMRCTQLTIHLKPKHREPEGSLIASLIGGIGKGQAAKWNKDGGVSGYDSLHAQRQDADVERTGYPGHSAPSSERDKCGDCGAIGVCEC